MSIIFAILLFSILIFVHELGHFIAAKLSGVQVNEFSVFMGPAIVKWKRGETLYAIRCIPIGGYCAMEGEDEESKNPRAFTAAKWWKRLIILLAGAFMNFVIGLLLLVIVNIPAQYFPTTQVEAVEPQSAFYEQQSILPGDVIQKIDGQTLFVNEDFTLLLNIRGDGHHDVLVERQGKDVLLKDVLFEKRTFEGETSPRYGLSFCIEEPSVGSCLSYSWNKAMDYVRVVKLSLEMLFSGEAGMSDMSGPVGIVDTMSDISQSGETFGEQLLILLNFGAMIAINLAVMNLLPIPALDGGRALCLLITVVAEKITGKKLNPKYEGYLHMAGMILLLGLMAFVTLNDILRLF